MSGPVRKYCEEAVMPLCNSLCSIISWQYLKSTQVGKIWKSIPYAFSLQRRFFNLPLTT